VISAAASSQILSWIFADPTGPMVGGFQLSLHTNPNQSDGSSELVGGNYARASYGQGLDFWLVGSRAVTNKEEIVWPQSADETSGIVWQPVRSIGIWDAVTGEFIWSLALDAGSVNVGYGDVLSVPPNGLVISFV
jgi:hypothetical protein